MKLHNTLTKSVDEFKPLKGKAVGLYTCGPTVYDHIHIGNLSAFIATDTLHRTLEVNDYTTKHVMNFTDVDDKTIARSMEKYPDLDSKDALLKLTRDYEDIFLRDLSAVGNDSEAYKFVRATESIDAMQELVTNLHKNGFAYITDDGVYFSIAKYKESGKNYGQLVEINSSSTSQHRISNDEYDKDSISDFALWKIKKGDEPSWEYTLDGAKLEGRPGWHIECSAMSSANLGQPFDIHTGGIDLAFPHHENEIAQSTACTDSNIYAKYFVHNEHILVDGKKMSKSLNNFYTLENITKKGFSALDFRMMVLQSHYRSQVNFTWESLQAAHNRLVALRSFADLRFQPVQTSSDNSVINQAQSDILEAMSDDMNTPKALSALSNIENYFNDNLLSTDHFDEFNGFLTKIDKLLGLNLLGSKDISKEQKTLLRERDDARKNKDWAKSDEVRDKLLKQEIVVRDTEHGQIWSRIYGLAVRCSI